MSIRGSRACRQAHTCSMAYLHIMNIFFTNHTYRSYVFFLFMMMMLTMRQVIGRNNGVVSEVGGPMVKVGLGPPPPFFLCLGTVSGSFFPGFRSYKKKVGVECEKSKIESIKPKSINE